MPRFKFTASAPSTDQDLVKYWDGYILDEEEIFDSLTPDERRGVLNTLNQFSLHDYKGAGYKAFVGAPVDTLRVNIKDRLIFSTHMVANYRCAIIHGFMHHNYHAYLYTNNPHAAPDYNKKHHDAMTRALLTSKNQSPPSAKSEPLPISVETFYHKKIVELTSEQRHCVFDPASTHKSGVITGAAGLGKTLVMLTSIKAALAQNPDRRIRCITPCRLLTKNLNHRWMLMRSFA